MKSLPHWGASVLLAAPLVAWGLGLGDIELKSALNQAFEAEIALSSATPEELADLKVGLAARETFDRYGLERTTELSALEFRVVRNSAGRDVIRVSSRQPIADPFLTMLIEATWPRGRLLREYTVLLDPPLFSPDIAAEPPIRQAATSTPPPGAAGGAIARTPAPAVQTPQPTNAAPAAASGGTAPPRGAQTSASSSSQPAGRLADGSYGPVQRAETLWNIASQLRPDGVSVNQMMVGLYEANPSAFDGNMNNLRRGATLTAPERDRLLAMTAATATAEVRRHESSWLGPGQAPDAAADQPEPQQARLRLVPPSADSLVGTGTAPAAAGSGSSRTGQGAGSATANADVARLQGEVEALRSELENSRRLLELRDGQLQALQARLGEAEQPAAAAPTETATAVAPQASAPGVDLESEQLFIDGDEPSAADASATGPTAATPTPPPAVVAPAAVPPAAVSRVVTQPAAAPSLLSRVLDWIANPLLLIGFGVGAVLLTAVWYLRQRRDDVDDVTGRWDALEAEVEQEVYEDTARLKRQVSDDSVIVEEQPRRGEFDRAGAVAADLDVVDDTLSSQTVINLDQADSLAEADFHMAYGLYDQAAELVQKALENEPHRRDLKLKLLEVYFVWGNKDAFLGAARDLRDELGNPPGGDWDKVLIMGKQICPEESIFAEAAASGAVDLDLQGDGSTALDFAFDDREGSGTFASGERDRSELDLDFASSTGTDVDLELAATGERFGTEDEDDSGQDVVYDFDDSLDIGERTAAGLEAALFDDSDDDEDDSDTGVAGFAGHPFSDDGSEDETGTADAPDIELDGLAATQESPTVERSNLDGDWSAFNFDGPTVEQQAFGPDSPTMETPTVETAGPDAATVETPTIETPTVETAGPEAPTVETPTIETPYGGTARLQVRSAFDSIRDESQVSGEHTEEIDLDDLGLSIDDLEGLPADVGELPHADDGESDTREQPALTADDDLLSATGVTQVLSDDDELEQMNMAVLSDRDLTLMAPGYGDDSLSGTEVLPDRLDTDLSGNTSLLKALQGFGGEAHKGNGLDLDLEDLAAAFESNDTVEQPRSSFDGDIFEGGAETPIDLDIGLDVVGADDPTGTEDVDSMDSQTMTEIGTKLDLARAYIDMGDPEGARSILEEVLDEGDAGQRHEAQGLIDVLSV